MSVPKLGSVQGYSPPSFTVASSLFGSDETYSLSLACSSTLHNSVSSWTCRGSRLSRIVPWKRAASCGIIANLLLRSRSPIVDVLRPSILHHPVSFCVLSHHQHGRRTYLMLPEIGSMIRKSASVNELFPAPVRPTTPIFSRALMDREMSLSTGSSPSRYLVE